MKLCQPGTLHDFPILTLTFMLVNIITIIARPTSLQDRAILFASSANGGERIDPNTRLAVYTRGLDLLMQRSPRIPVEDANAQAWRRPGFQSDTPPPPAEEHIMPVVNEAEARDLAPLLQILHHLLLGTNLYPLIQAIASIISAENEPLHSNIRILERAYTSLTEGAWSLNNILIRSGYGDNPAAVASRSESVWEAVPQNSSSLTTHARQLCYMPPSGLNPQHVGEKTVAKLVQNFDATPIGDIMDIYNFQGAPLAPLLSDIDTEIVRIVDCLASLCNRLHEGQ